MNAIECLQIKENESIICFVLYKNRHKAVPSQKYFVFLSDKCMFFSHA